MSEIIKNRYSFSFLFDVTNGNPNGDTDNDNMPRMDRHTDYGQVTAECLKRKIRDAMHLLAMNDPDILQALQAMDDPKGYELYVVPGTSLERQNIRAYEKHGINPEDLTKEKSDPDAAKKKREKKKSDPDLSKRVVEAICETFGDVRLFGDVITELTKNKLPGGQLCGPVQLDTALSIEPIQPMRIGITRVTRTTDKEILEDGKLTAMASRYIVPYGLYRCNGTVSAFDAKATGLTMFDLALLWKSITYMFEEDRSTARGAMTLRELFVFRHDSPLGNAKKQDLEDLIKITRKDPTSALPARSYDDYRVEFDEGKLPNRVDCKRFTDPYAPIETFQF